MEESDSQSRIVHAYFGELDSNRIRETFDAQGVMWERDLDFNGHLIDTSLWVERGQALNKKLLDAFAALLQNLASVDSQARRHLVEYLNEDDNFITCHMDLEIPGLAALAADGEVSPDAFVKAMQLTDITLWTQAEPDHVVLDYRIDPEHSDEILAVKLTAQGELIAIDWES